MGRENVCKKSSSQTRSQEIAKKKEAEMQAYKDLDTPIENKSQKGLG